MKKNKKADAYKVLPELAVGVLNREYYLYDSTRQTPFKTLPFQNVSKSVYELVRQLIELSQHGLINQTEISKLSKKNKGLIEDLLEAGYLLKVPSLLK